jgi:hypothetical protein
MKNLPVLALLLVVLNISHSVTLAASTFLVSTYGAVANSTTDSGPAIRNAIAAAIQAGPGSVVKFDPGVYKVGAIDNQGLWGKRRALLVYQANGITLQGGAKTTAGAVTTRIDVTDPESAGLVFWSSQNVTVNDIAVDYETVPYAQGTITKINYANYTYEVTLDGAGYLDPGHVAFSNAIMVFGYTVRQDATTGETIYGPQVIGAQPMGAVSPGVWQFKNDPNLVWGSGNKYAGFPNAFNLANLKVGDRYVHWARSYASAVTIQECSNVTLNKLHVYASPNVAFLPYDSSNVTLDGCNIITRPGSSRLISTNADGVHAREMRGPLVIQNCSFTGLGDDAVNIHCTPIKPIQTISANTIVFEKSSYSIKPGDRLEHFDITTANTKNIYTVQSVTDISYGWQVAFTTNLPGLNGNIDIFYNLKDTDKTFSIVNNYVGPHRGRGLLLSARNGTITNNHFHNYGMLDAGWAIVLQHDDGNMAEGPVSRNLTIRNNLFTGSGGSQPAIKAFPLSTFNWSAATGLTYKGQATGLTHSGINISDNTYNNLTGPAADLFKVGTLKTTGNLLKRTNSTYALTGNPAAAFLLRGCTGATVNTNTSTDPSFPNTKIISITP